jgi:hypothetical protein
MAVGLVLCRWFWCGVEEGGDMSSWDDKGFRFFFGVIPFLLDAYGKEREVEPIETLTASLLGRAIA